MRGCQQLAAGWLAHTALENARSADLAVVQQALDTNLLGAWRVTTAFIPLLRHSTHGRIVNVSSEAGSLAGMGGGTPAYSVSKAAHPTFRSSSTCSPRTCPQRPWPGLSSPTPTSVTTPA